MKANAWTTYRTRFLVKARQLDSRLSFTDVLGRQHSGCKGDYLVESSDGVLRIAPRQIFEDVYVALERDIAGWCGTTSLTGSGTQSHTGLSGSETRSHSGRRKSAQKTLKALHPGTAEVHRVGLETWAG